MSAIAKTIRETKESDTYDLKGLNQDQALAFVEAAFKDPMKLEMMIKISLTVGAGKLARQKYDDDLGKWICNGLRDLGYEDDRGASLAMECAGSFKFQHDTGKNLKVVHVFPKVVEEEDDGNKDTENGGEEQEQVEGGMSATWLCTASEMETFKKMVEAKMPAWMEKRRCAEHLREEINNLQNAEMKLAKMETLSNEEQRLYDSVDQTLLEEKISYLTGLNKEMVEQGKLTYDEKTLVLEQIAQRQANIEEKIAECNPEKEKKKLEKLNHAKQQLIERKEKIVAITPIKHELVGGNHLLKLWTVLIPMEKLLEKAGPKGRWSPKLTPSEVTYLGDKDDFDEKVKSLLGAARHWFENEREFKMRVQDVKSVAIQNAKNAKPKAKPSQSASNGWATVGSNKKKNPKKSNNGKSANRGGAFAALMD